MKLGLLAVLFLLVPVVAQAEQGCPDGFIPNAAGTPGVACVPGQAPNWGDTPPPPRWATRWGAFAYDDASGATGVAAGRASKREAENAAVAHCKSKGGRSCKPLLPYYNQCGAVAWGEGANVRAAGAPTKEEASERALVACSRQSSSCEVFFAECSYSERIQ